MLVLLCCVVGFRYIMCCHKVSMADFHESNVFGGCLLFLC